MLHELLLPHADGTLAPYTPGPPGTFALPSGSLRSRVPYAAAHVVCNPLANINPTLEVALDWEATLAYRRYLWSLGFSVAEAMDTAQRGMGLDWAATQELIRRSLVVVAADNSKFQRGSEAPYIGQLHMHVASPIHDVNVFAPDHTT